MKNNERVKKLAVSILAAVEKDRRAGGEGAGAAEQWLASPQALFWARAACGDTGGKAHGEKFQVDCGVDAAAALRATSRVGRVTPRRRRVAAE